MKIILAAAILSFLVTGCDSKKTEEKKEIIKKDSIVSPPTDTANTSAKRDTSSAVVPELGGLGDLHLDMTADKTTQLLGQPDSKSKAEEWGADGMLHQDWLYKSKGITLNMYNNQNAKDQAVFSITVTSPCTFKTKKNIGIGSSYTEVMNAYEKEIDPSATDKSIITIGSVYGGIIIHFKKDKAEKIFVGAAAE